MLARNCSAESYAGRVADPSTYRPSPGEIPELPGVYRFYDQSGRVIYVGKAKSLRSRLNSYFQDYAGLHPRTQQLVITASGVEWTVVNTEVEALQLEYTWIKEFDPRFNVMYRDDKSYPWLAITVDDEYPRVMVTRGKRRKGVRYFGPYTHVWAIRETMDLLLRVFPMRSCSPGVFRRARAANRPCLLADIGKCAAPCVDRVSESEHREITDGFLGFIGGKTSGTIKRIETEMNEAAAAQEYERAASRRDDLSALRQVLEKNAIVFSDGTDADVLALAEDPLEAAVQIFSVRDGRIRGQRGWIAERADDADAAALIERAIVTLYQEQSTDSVPREVLVAHVPDNGAALRDWLGGLRGSQVSLRVPRRGDKRALMQTVEQNASQSLARHKLRRSSDLTARSQALEELQEALGLAEVPLRIECFDISNLQGEQMVASMVVFEDGLARKSEYRRYTIRHQGQSDVASMHEVISRRAAQLVRSREDDAEDAGIDPETGLPRRFAYGPSLIVVDGGAPQVSAASQALAEAGVEDIALAGLAKRLEEVWLPDTDDPVVLPRTSEALYLLQRIRDEAHRFAISHHRKRRAKAATASALDDVPGLGPTRKKALLRAFGSVKKIRAATAEEIETVPGFGPALAGSVVASLHSGNSGANIAGNSAGNSAGSNTASVDTQTGEILEDK